MKTIRLDKKFVAAIVTLILISTAICTLVVQQYFPQIGSIKAEGPEDPLEAWSEASYVIWQYNSTFYACRNMSTLMVETLSSNATTVIDYVLGNLSLNGGGTGFVKAGTYTLDGKIIARSNTTLLLENGVTFTQTYAGWTNYYDGGTIQSIGTPSSITNFHIIALGHATLKCEGTDTDETGIIFDNTTYSSIENLEVYNVGGNAIYMRRAEYNTFSNLYIHHYSLITDTKAIYLSGLANYNDFLNIHIDGTGLALSARGGYLITDSYLGGVFGNKIIGGLIENYQASHGIYIGSSTYKVAANIVSGVVFYNQLNCIQLNAGQENIIDFAAYNCTYGIALADGVSLPSVGNMISFSMSDSYCGAHIYVQATCGYNSYNEIHMTVSNVTHGILFDGNSAGPSGFRYNQIYISGNATYGIEFNEGSANAEACNNDFYCQTYGARGVYWDTAFGRYNQFYGNIIGTITQFYGVSGYQCAYNNVGNMTGNIVASDWRAGNIIYNGTTWMVYGDGVLRQIA